MGVFENITLFALDTSLGTCLFYKIEAFCKICDRLDDKSISSIYPYPHMLGGQQKCVSQTPILLVLNTVFNKPGYIHH